jgi:hypothetical protein
LARIHLFRLQGEVVERRHFDVTDEEKRASEVLDEICAIAESRAGEHIALGELLKGEGSRLFGLALMILALPEAIPFPAVGLTGLVAIPIIALSLSMVLGGTLDELPGWICRRRVRAETAAVVARRGGRLVRWIERLSRPRRAEWTRRGRLIGLLCIGLSVVASLPIPFTNVAPGVTMVAIGLGIVQRDGVLVLVAGAVGVLICVMFAAMLVVGSRMLF